MEGVGVGVLLVVGVGLGLGGGVPPGDGVGLGVGVKVIVLVGVSVDVAVGVAFFCLAFACRFTVAEVGPLVASLVMRMVASRFLPGPFASKATSTCRTLSLPLFPRPRL